VRAEGGDEVVRERDGAGAAALGLLGVEGAVRLDADGALGAEGRRVGVEVEVLPAEGHELAAAEAGADGGEEKEAPLGRSGSEEAVDLEVVEEDGTRARDLLHADPGDAGDEAVVEGEEENSAEGGSQPPSIVVSAPPASKQPPIGAQRPPASAQVVGLSLAAGGANSASVGVSCGSAVGVGVVVAAARRVLRGAPRGALRIVVAAGVRVGWGVGAIGGVGGLSWWTSLSRASSSSPSSSRARICCS
jgi:hypothetical protein